MPTQMVIEGYVFHCYTREEAEQKLIEAGYILHDGGMGCIGYRHPKLNYGGILFSTMIDQIDEMVQNVRPKWWQGWTWFK